MEVITTTLTREQIELCKAALLNLPLQGNIQQLLPTIEKIHGTIEALDAALKPQGEPEAE